MRDFQYKHFLSGVRRGSPIGPREMAEHGLTVKYAHQLQREGWLTRLGPGTYMLPGEEPLLEAALAHLAKEVPGFHVGGKTALAWRGVRHQVEARPVLSLWGSTWARVPDWFSQRFPCHYQSSTLFDERPEELVEVSAAPGYPPDVPVSTTERALLELVSEVGKRRTVQEARELVESLRSLRPAVLEVLLSKTHRIKVVRLLAQLAEESSASWASVARARSRALGGASRMVVHLPEGGYLDLRP